MKKEIDLSVETEWVARPARDPLKSTNRRPDFQPRNGRPPVRYSGTDRDSHLDKMYRYREHILAELSGKVATELFALVDIRSMDKIESEKPNSAIAIYSDFLQYLRVINARNLRAFPVNDAALEFYLDYLYGEGRKKATIDRQVASLAKWHQWLELDDFRKTYRVSDRLKKTRLKTAAPQKQAEGLTADALFRAQELFSALILRDCADMALLFTAFYTLCRRSELVSFEWSDFQEEAKGLSGTLFLRSSKTDKDHKGNYLYLSPQTVGILKHWRNMSGQKTGKIFRCVYSDGQIGSALSDKGVDRAFKRIAHRLGLDSDVFSAHSTRVGAAQEMVARNIESTKIVNAGRWSSDRMVAAYTRRLAAHRGAAADLARLLEKNANLPELVNATRALSSSLDSVQAWLPSELAENSDRDQAAADSDFQSRGRAV